MPRPPFEGWTRRRHSRILRRITDRLWERMMNESDWSEYVAKRIDELPMCAGKRGALMDELRYASQVTDDVLRLGRYVRVALDGVRAMLAVCAGRVVAATGQQSPRIRDKA